MAEETKNKTFEKSTHQQKWLVEQLMYNLKNDEVLWQQGWITRGAPESAITGKKYRGSNNFLLTIVAYKRGYRWGRKCLDKIGRETSQTLSLYIPHGKGEIIPFNRRQVKVLKLS